MDKSMYGVSYVTGPSEMKAFLQFPYEHYASDPNWIAPLYIQQRDLLDPSKNPYFADVEHAYFLAEKNDQVCGRIGVFINRSWNAYQKQQTGFFGFFECRNDAYLAKLLIEVATDWLQERGMNKMIGPINPGFMYELGMLVDGHETEPYIMMPWTKKYYDKLLTDAGLEKEIDLFAYVVDDKTVALDRINRAEQIVRKRMPELSIRPVRLSDFDKEVRIIRDIFNQAWKDNWGFSPVGEDEFNHIAKDLKLILDKDIAHIAEINGKAVGFSVALPDMNQAFRHIRNGRLLPFGIFKLLWHKRKINRIRTALMGVIPEYRGKGIDALLHREAIVKGLAKGYSASELSWLLETNTDMIRVAEKIGGWREKTYRIYRRKI